jgi:hypothetical protein
MSCLIPCTFKVPNRIVLLRNLCRRRLHISRVFPMGFLASLFFRWAGGWPTALTPNLEDQVIFGQGFLPLNLDKPVSNCKAAVLVSVRPGYPPYLVSITLSATRGGARWKTSNSSRISLYKTWSHVRVFLFLYSGNKNKSISHDCAWKSLSNRIYFSFVWWKRMLYLGTAYFHTKYDCVLTPVRISLARIPNSTAILFCH